MQVLHAVCVPCFLSLNPPLGIARLIVSMADVVCEIWCMLRNEQTWSNTLKSQAYTAMLFLAFSV